MGKYIKKSFLAVVVAIAVAGTIFSKVEAVESNTIIVKGEGNISVTPDMATINIGVKTENEVLKTAKEENNTIMQNVTSEIKKLGITDKDLKTINYSEYPDYDYSSTKSKITGYSVSNTLSITIRDLDKISDVMSVSEKTGANVTHSLVFSVSDEQTYYAEALRSAMSDASFKASVIAESMGVKVKGIKLVEETSYSSGVLLKTESYMAADSAAGAPIEKGVSNITATVTVQYGF